MPTAGIRDNKQDFFIHGRVLRPLSHQNQHFTYYNQLLGKRKSAALRIRDQGNGSSEGIALQAMGRNDRMIREKALNMAEEE